MTKKDGAPGMPEQIWIPNSAPFDEDERTAYLDFPGEGYAVTEYVLAQPRELPGAQEAAEEYARLNGGYLPDGSTGSMVRMNAFLAGVEWALKAMGRHSLPGQLYVCIEAHWERVLSRKNAVPYGAIRFYPDHMNVAPDISFWAELDSGTLSDSALFRYWPLEASAPSTPRAGEKERME